LRTAGRTVDAVRYVDAPEGKIVTWSEGGPVWEPLGATDRPVVTAESGPVTAFTLPDSPGVVFETLRSAEKRILLAGYTYTSPRVTDALIAAARRGVTVEVLVDAEPVGGLTRREARLLDRLTAAGVNVTVLGGPRARYDFHHAKYAVVDSRALVTTENWKPAGVGGNASRGWGVVTAQRAIVDGLTETFRADAGWRDGRPWTAYRTHRQFEPARSPPANGTYPSPRDPERVRVQNTHLLVAPDNAEQSVRRVLAEADDRILVEQVSLGGPGHPFVRETIEAAQRGVHVRILLSGAWYAREENQRLADRLNERAEREELPLSVRIADPRGRFEKIHAKGVVVDDAHALVGSLNWNNNSVRENREVALLLEGEGVGNYYARAFEADWRASGDRLRLRIGLIAVVGLAALLVVIRAGRIRFEAAE
jgi:phosphatidylserine/phosphatidylglycerophosphate/cardiolipin synthase-like enzyme